MKPSVLSSMPQVLRRFVHLPPNGFTHCTVAAMLKNAGVVLHEDDWFLCRKRCAWCKGLGAAEVSHPPHKHIANALLEVMPDGVHAYERSGEHCSSVCKQAAQVAQGVTTWPT